MREREKKGKTTSPLPNFFYLTKFCYFRYGPFPMMFWPWDEIGENMQLCLAGLRDVDGSVDNF